MNSPPLSISSSTDHRTELASLLRGQKIVVPDLLSIWPEWKVRQHPDIDEMRKKSEGWFQTYVTTARNRARQRKVDSPMCAGGTWTRVSPRKFEILCSLMAWFFLWDDEVDCGELTEDPERAEVYCDDTVAYIKSCIQPELGISPPAPGRFHNSGAWSDIAGAMKIGQTLEDRNRFAEAIIQFIDSVREQQSERLEGISTIKGYIERRVVAVASTPCIMVLPWAYDLNLPPRIMEHEATNLMCREIGIGVSLVNDILSLKKEIANDEVDSIVPLLVHHGGISVQEAVNRTLDMIQQSHQNFRAAAAQLRLAVATMSLYVQGDVETLIAGCMDVLVGSYVWSLNSPRYLPKSAFTGQSLSFEVSL